VRLESWWKIEDNGVAGFDEGSWLVFLPRRRVMSWEFPEIELTAEQEAEAAKIEAVLTARGREVNRHMARLLASKPNRELFGETEFQIRDAVHRLGATGLETALSERKKRGAKERGSFVRPAGTTPSSSAFATAA
jgi:hypothetical protein